MFVLIFVVVIAGAIMLHEAGHFATAKLFGMKAERFFLGFGPTLWSFRRGETEYGVKAIPAGGFVKISGMNKFEEVDPADEHRAFYTQPAWQRVVVLSAGSVTHFVLAGILIFAALAFFAVPKLQDGAPVYSDPDTRIGIVLPDTPAARAGLRQGDLVTAIDGQQVETFDDLVAAVTPRGGEQVTLEIRRDGATRTLQAELAATNPDGERRGYLGVGPQAELQYEQRSLAQAAGAVVVGEYSLPTQTLRALGGLASAFSPSSLQSWLGQADQAEERSADGPISLVGAGQVVNALGRMGEFSSILLLLAQLNIVLGALNMLPLPPLDGGHVAVLGIEEAVNGVRRRRGQEPNWQADPRAVTPVALAVLLFFAALSLTAIYIDIVNPASNLLQ
ncbi:MAG: M50 family metallopeptidase [Egibacteraceae bacterium]